MNTQGFVWKFFYALYINFHLFIHSSLLINFEHASAMPQAGTQPKNQKEHTAGVNTVLSPPVRSAFQTALHAAD